MIHYVKGEITYKHPEYVVVEAAGVGYQIFITAAAYARLEKMERGRVLTYHHVKEDEQTLYGFADAAEKHLFTLLIGVSGVGPSTALQVLSQTNTDELRGAIIAENEALLKSVKGIGAKTAKRIILDLKDKLTKEAGPDAKQVAFSDNTLRQEALMGLEQLGIPKPRAQKALNQAIVEQADLQTAGELIKAALKILS